MLRAASRAAHLLNDSTELVINFVGKQICKDGGFKGRTSQSDLYYTVFGIEALLALGAKLPAERILNYLQRFKDGDSLDLVHLACLARCWASVTQSQSQGPCADTRTGIACRLENYRSSDGGYSNLPGAKYGTAYGCFLALGAYQDLNIEMTNRGALAQPLGGAGLAGCIKSLRTKDRAYSNEPGGQIGSTPATAATLVVQHYLGLPIDDYAAHWLLSQFDIRGGFLASPALREVGVPDLLSTAVALHGLALIGISIDHIKEKCLDFLDSLWCSDGGFCGNWADRTLDCEYTYYGLLALGHLSE